MSGLGRKRRLPVYVSGAGLSAVATFVHLAEKVWFEPRVTNAAACEKVCLAEQGYFVSSRNFRNLSPS